MRKLLIYYALSISFFSCDCDRFSGVSEDIEDSKKKKVFILELVRDKTIKINDTLKIYVKEAWIEDMWTHECYRKIKRDMNFRGCQYQLCVNSVNELPFYSIDWEIGYSLEESFRYTSKTSLVMDLTEPRLDNYCIPVYKDYLQNDINKNIKIGDFCLKSLHSTDSAIKVSRL